MRKILSIIITTSFISSYSFASDRFPGSYVVTIKGELPDGRKYSKLAMYSFRAGTTPNAGSLRQDFWIWYDRDPLTTTTTTQTYAFSNKVIGSVPGESNPDATKKILGVKSFLNSPAKTLTNATWIAEKVDGEAKSVTITWPSGSSEKWLVTWTDANLNKIELQQAGYTYGDNYVPTPESIYRNRFALNAGWGFGGKGPGFDSPYTGELKDKNYAGLFKRFNAWDNLEESVKLDQQNIQSRFTTTSTGVSRLQQPHTDRNGVVRQAFFYLSPLDSDSFTNRKVIYYNGNDFNGNDFIELSDYGHTYAGLRIVDAAGKTRGTVFADTSYAAVYGGHTISALYYLDTNTCDQRIGISPIITNECSSQ